MIKNIVYDVDLGRLLGLGRMLFEQGADGEGMAVDVAGGLGHVEPVTIGRAVQVGVGEEDDLVVLQRLEFGDVQFRLAARGEPEVVGLHFGHDDGRLLRLHHRDGSGGSLAEQMESEEAVLRLPVIGHLPAAAQQVGGPCRLAVVVAVTVAAVVHDLAVAQIAVLVDLPEDDAAVATDAQSVALHRPLHLCRREVAAADHCLAEHRRAAEPPLPHRPRVPVLTDLLGQCLERMPEKLLLLHNSPLLMFHIELAHVLSPLRYESDQRSSAT